MKKILAIALAVVMVLSMASAFAFDWAWTCETTSAKNGKATIEVIPYVKVNDGCGGFNWVQSNCAAAVKTENVYFVVKLTVPADINPVWYKHVDTAQLTFAKEGFVISANADAEVKVNMPDLTSVADDEKDGWVYYLVGTPTSTLADKTSTATANAADYVWTVDQSADCSSANKLTVPDNVTINAAVNKAAKAKVCAKLTSNFNGIGEWLVYGDYAIYNASAAAVGTHEAKREPATITVIPACSVVDAEKATLKFSNDDSVNTASINAANSKVATFSVDPTSKKVTNISAAVLGSCDTNFVSLVQTYFNLGIDTCVNADNIRANFGWKDKVESCYTWSGNATAIVDVQCEVEIPKTGDVSVIAYAVMAVVAAAGAMGLKK